MTETLETVSTSYWKIIDSKEESSFNLKTRTFNQTERTSEIFGDCNQTLCAKKYCKIQ